MKSVFDLARKVLEAEDVLKRAASVSQAAGEAEARLVKLREQEQAVFNLTRSRHAESRQEAEQVMAEAVRESKDVREKTEALCQRSVDAARARVESLAEEEEGLRASVAALAEQVRSLEDGVEEKSKEYDDLSKAVSDLKAKLTSI